MRGIGQTFGPPDDTCKYTLGNELGSGATANVSVCTCGTESYAVKSIRLAKLRKQPNFGQLSEMFFQEIAILFSLRHPRVVCLHDVVEEDNSLHLVMDLVDGGDLSDRIAETSSLTEPEAKHYFTQIAQGLQYIHSKGIVHSDLKPDNVLLTSAEHHAYPCVKLSDFGHSWFDREESHGRGQTGTAHYMAPEIWDFSLYDRRVDLWSLGVTLYVMLMGTLPFWGEDLHEQIHKCNFSFGAVAISEQAQNLIRSLLKREPTERLPLDWCLVHPWVASHGGLLRRILNMVNEVEPRILVERFHIPPQTFPASFWTILRRDLQKWMIKFRFAAFVDSMMVVVNFGNELAGDETVWAGRSEIRQLLHFHFGAVPVSTSTEEVQHLRVTEQGAGLVLDAQPGGMRVFDVFDVPGQPSLKVNDLIFNIGGVVLYGSAEHIEEAFDANFRHGVQVNVRREEETQDFAQGSDMNGE